MSKESLFSEAILRAKRQRVLPLIADIKPISPRDGELLGGRDVAELAQHLASAGACAFSVVTESRHFGGNLDILRRVSEAVKVPVLRKDFLLSGEEIKKSRDQGAAAVLLILAKTPDPLASAFHRLSLELGLEVVVEVHTKQEIERALALSPAMIGINNRDILRLETDSGDVGVTEELAPLIPNRILKISESSLRTEWDIRRAIGAGADAVLLGTAILKSCDPGAYLSRLIREVRI